MASARILTLPVMIPATIFRIIRRLLEAIESAAAPDFEANIS
jgi:hypothetical protein